MGRYFVFLVDMLLVLLSLAILVLILLFAAHNGGDVSVVHFAPGEPYLV